MRSGCFEFISRSVLFADGKRLPSHLCERSKRRNSSNSNSSSCNRQRAQLGRDPWQKCSRRNQPQQRNNNNSKRHSISQALLLLLRRAHSTRHLMTRTQNRRPQRPHCQQQQLLQRSSRQAVSSKTLRQQLRALCSHHPPLLRSPSLLRSLRFIARLASGRATNSQAEQALIFAVLFVPYDIVRVAFDVDYRYFWLSANAHFAQFVGN